MTPEALTNAVNTLAKETKATVEGVHLITDHCANNIAAAAWRAECRAGSTGGENWLDMAMACNAAANPHARAIIEHKARIAYDILQQKAPAP